ncbi:MAG: hypothetical protein E6590_13900 [Clostridiales bacterium]|nr:hypothetical protein [Clostridiales bacterium]
MVTISSGAEKLFESYELSRNAFKKHNKNLVDAASNMVATLKILPKRGHYAYRHK